MWALPGAPQPDGNVLRLSARSGRSDRLVALAPSAAVLPDEGTPCPRISRLGSHETTSVDTDRRARHGRRFRPLRHAARPTGLFTGRGPAGPPWVVALGSMPPATLDLASPEHYQRNGYPHAEWTWLRRNAPVFWYE